MFPDEKYPVPKLGPPKHAPDVMPYCHETELGQHTTILDDGRPALVQTWFDHESRALLLTVFYSVIGAEHFTDSDHLGLLTRSKVINNNHRAKPLDSIGLKRITDDTGEMLFSLTVVLAKDWF